MIENLENEQWLPIDGYDGYEVSNYGRVKSLNYNKTKQERILKQGTTKYGYQLVMLCNGGKHKMFSVHRLVAMAFIPNPNNYPLVNHKDEVKTNNHVENLEWCTAEYNNNYGTVRERCSGENHPMYGKFGKKHHSSKQIIQLTLSGEVVRKWDCIADVTRELGYHNTNISACCKGRYKSAHGYKWRYA